MKKIVELELEKVAERLKGHDIIFEVAEEAKTFLIEKGYDEKYGARPLRRAVEHYLEDALAEALLRGELKRGDPVKVVLIDDKIGFEQPAHTNVTS